MGSVLPVPASLPLVFPKPFHRTESRPPLLPCLPPHCYPAYPLLHIGMAEMLRKDDLLEGIWGPKVNLSEGMMSQHPHLPHPGGLAFLLPAQAPQGSTCCTVSLTWKGLPWFRGQGPGAKKKNTLRPVTSVPDRAGAGKQKWQPAFQEGKDLTWGTGGHRIIGRSGK